MEIDRALRYEAATRLGDIDNLRSAALWISQNPQGLSTRVQEFEEAIGVLNQMIIDPNLDAAFYQNVGRLKGLMLYAGDTPLTLQEAFEMHDSFRSGDDYESMGDYVQGAFEKIKQKTVSGEWQFPHEITDNPNQLASAMLIEGYGVFIEDFEEVPGYARNFVLALEEVLLTHDPNSRLLKDVIGWMKEESADFSPEMAAQIMDFKETECGPLEEEVAYLNMKFKNGASAHEVLDQIRRFERPIAVDFNNVLADNLEPLEMNPDAPAFIEELRKIGNIFIVTSATDWNSVQEFLEKNGLWYPDMVLMTYQNYEFTTREQASNLDGIKIREEFADHAQANNMGIAIDDLNSFLSGKRVAPIFMKPFLIPLVDDSSINTEFNPGMLGIRVKNFSPKHGRLTERSNADRLSLSEAAEIIRAYYSSL